jgi:hypothetical protein
MMLTVRLKTDVPKYDHFVIALDFLEGTFEIVDRILPITLEPVLIGGSNPFRRVEETLSVRVVASPQQQSFDRLFGFFAAWPAGLAVFLYPGGHGGSWLNVLGA